MSKTADEKAGQNDTAKGPRLCPACNSPTVLRVGRFGEFLSCSGYPDCKWSRNIAGRRKKITPQTAERMTADLKLTLDFIQAVGSLDRAFSLLRAASYLGEAESTT